MTEATLGKLTQRANKNGDRRQLSVGLPFSPGLRAAAALALVFALGAIFNAQGSFFHWGTHRDLLRQVSVYGILACGMTLVVLSGGIDLAVGSVLGLCSVLSSLLMLQWGVSAWIAVPASIVAGAAMGGLSGTLIARFKLQPFIATLAMMVFARGAAKWVSGGQKISTAVQGVDGSFSYVQLPRFFEALDHRILGENVAVVSLVFLGCAGLCWYFAERLRYGRYLRAIGGNEEAARLSGVPVSRMKIAVYAISGALAAIAGICQAVQEQQGDPEAGVSYELTAIAMAVIGGTRLSGGRGGIGLTLIGALTIGYLEKILSINAVGEASRLMLTGAIIVAAVLFQRPPRKEVS
jgi:ribose transport system permease protein